MELEESDNCRFSELILVSQAKPSQAKPSQGSNWAKRKSTSPCLLAIPAFGRVAGLYIRHLNSDRGIRLR